MAKKQQKARKKQYRKRDVSPANELQKSGWWEQLSEGRQHAVCLLLLVVVSLVFFAPVHFSGKSLAQSDTVFFRSMVKAMVDYETETGEKALWSPNAFGGMPGYMISTPLEVTQLDDIPRLLRYVIWPSSHFIFLLAGVYLLAFYLVRNKWASVFAACAFGLTTYIPVFLMAGHNSKLVAMAFAPWLILAFVYAIRQPGLLSGLLFAAALAINIRAGHVQITYYVAFLLLVWWCVEGIDAFRNGRLKPFGLSTGWLAVGAVLGLLMVAQPYLSNFEYKAHTIRGAASGGEPGGLSWEYAMAWSQGVGELFTLIAADSYGGSIAYWGPKGGTGGPHYLGGLVLLFCLVAVYKVRTREVLALAVGVLLMVLFSLGEHFPLLNRLMFDFFPLFDSFRVPETWLGIVALATALLAAYGIAYLFDEKNEEHIQTALKAAGIVIGMLVVVLVMKDVFFSFERAGEAQFVAQQVARQNNVSANDPQVIATVERYLTQIKTERRSMFRDDVLRTILFLVVGAGTLFLLQRKKLSRVLAGIALALLVALDLGGVGRRYFDSENLSDATSIDDEITQYDFDRYILEQRDALGGSGHFRVLSLEFRSSPATTARPSYFYESLGGYHGAKLRLYQDFLERLLIDPSTGLPSENALDLMNTRYVVAEGRLPGAEAVFVDEKTRQVVNEREALPRAFFVGEIEMVATAEETWARIHSTDFEPSRTALVPAGAEELSTTPIDSSSVVEATLQSYNPHEILWLVNTDAPRLLVVSEIYYPAGWKAYLDDQEVPIHRVDYLLRGVEVAAGQHTLTMRFEPKSYEVGYWLTLLSTLLVYGTIAGLAGLTLWRRRQGSDLQDVPDADSADS